MAAASETMTQLLRHQVFIHRLASGEVAKFSPFLVQIERSLRDRLSGDELTDLSRARLERLLAAVHALLGGLFDNFSKELVGDLQKYAQYEAEFSSRALDRGTIAAFEAVVPSPTQIRASVLSSPLAVKGPGRGKLLEPFLEDFTRKQIDGLTGAIRRGAFEGKTNAQLVREIRGTAARGYEDGLLKVSARAADAVVRTAVQHVATVARLETFKTNSDIIESEEWLATLDKRTCPSCRSLDKRRFPIGKGPRPPLHIGCRCTMLPVLAEKYRKLMQGATRASKGQEGGQQVSADLSYYDWLKQQPAEFQDEVLGPMRAKLFRDGGISVSRFAELNLDKNFMPLTLDQMRALDPIAFSNAGL